MLIQFKKPDPRAGMTVRMDSSRGQQLIDAGAADRVAENGDAPRAEPEPTDGAPVPADEVAAAPAPEPTDAAPAAAPAKPTRSRK